MLFWRQFSTWLGGMGIIVLAVAVLPRLRIGGRQLLQSELAGPTDIERFSETIRETARRLWTLYVGLTIGAVVVLAALGWTGLDPAMTLFDAVAHAFSVVALGGFSTYNQSTAVFAPVTVRAAILMLIAGINFLRLYRVFVQRHFRILGRDEELGSTSHSPSWARRWSRSSCSRRVREREAFRHGAFQAVSVMTTTGFGTADSTAWGALATMTLLLLMFVGASAGSTGGSIKVIRHLLLFKMVRRELETIHREAVVPIRASGVPVEERALRSAVVFVCSTSSRSRSARSRC